MTYILIDSNYYDINSISKMISVPINLIEDIVNRGMSGVEDSFLTKEAILTLRKMKFATSMSTSGLSTDVTSKLISLFDDQDQFQNSLSEFVQKEVITVADYDQINEWANE